MEKKPASGVRNFRWVVTIFVLCSILLIAPVEGEFLEIGLSDIYLTLGDSHIFNVMFTNTHTDTSNITLKLRPQGSNYVARLLNHPLASISGDRKDLNSTDLSPLEERMFEVEITMMDTVLEQDGNLTISGTIVICGSCPEEFVNVSIHSMQIVLLPGLEIPALFLLITVAGLLYWRKEKQAI